MESKVTRKRDGLEALGRHLDCFSIVCGEVRELVSQWLARGRSGLNRTVTKGLQFPDSCKEALDCQNAGRSSAHPPSTKNSIVVGSCFRVMQGGLDAIERREGAVVWELRTRLCVRTSVTPVSQAPGGGVEVAQSQFV